MMRGVSQLGGGRAQAERRAARRGRAPAEEAALGEIEVSTFPLDSAMKRHRLLRLPILRGVVALGGSMVIGFRALEISANAQLPPEDNSLPSSSCRPRATGPARATRPPSRMPRRSRARSGRARSWSRSRSRSSLFFLVPVGLTSLIKRQLGSSILFWLVEGVIRTGLFLGYMLLLSRVRDLRRVFEYHGAEHKTISCYEAGLPLTPANAQRFSRLHPRCGTSFLLVVMIVAIFVFAPIGLPAWYWLMATRILGRAADRRHLLRADQVRRAQPQPALGAGADVAGPEAAAADHARARPRSARGGDRRARRRCSRWRRPGELSAADLVGVEVVA